MTTSLALEPRLSLNGLLKSSANTGQWKSVVTLDHLVWWVRNSQSTSSPSSQALASSVGGSFRAGLGVATEGRGLPTATLPFSAFLLFSLFGSLQSFFAFLAAVTFVSDGALSFEPLARATPPASLLPTTHCGRAGREAQLPSRPSAPFRPKERPSPSFRPQAGQSGVPR